MQKLDLKRELDAYRATSRFALIDVPPANYLMLDGAGDPNVSPAYAAAVEALFAVSYSLKFSSKASGRDYVVMPLEGLWWADDMDDFIARRKDRWRWTMMIMQPDWITIADVERAAAAVSAKGVDLPGSLRLEGLEEGACVQVLHIGSYDDEGPVLRQLHAEYLPANGLAETGKHHEIYLSDPRKTAPARLKTILRQPVRRV